MITCNSGGVPILYKFRFARELVKPIHEVTRNLTKEREVRAFRVYSWIARVDFFYRLYSEIQFLTEGVIRAPPRRFDCGLLASRNKARRRLRRKPPVQTEHELDMPPFPN